MGATYQIASPAMNKTDYYNRKGWYSIILQGVVDHSLILMLAGWGVYIMPVYFLTPLCIKRLLNALSLTKLYHQC